MAEKLSQQRRDHGAVITAVLKDGEAQDASNGGDAPFALGQTGPPRGRAVSTVNWDLIPRFALANTELVPGSNPLFGLNISGGALAVRTKSGLTQGEAADSSGGVC